MNTHNTQINDNSETNIQNDSWIRLTQYGEFPHTKGIQKVTPDSAKDMVCNFKSLLGTIKRKFGGIPIFIGHPDDPTFRNESGHQDHRAYAWVTDMDARPDGLYIKPKWSTPGKELLENAFYKHFSPRWAINPKTNQPTRLISIGLTNHPNILSDTIANTDEPNDIYPSLQELKEKIDQFYDMSDAFSIKIQQLEDTLFEIEEGTNPPEKISNAQTNIKTHSITNNLANQQPFTQNSNQFLQLVEAEVKSTGKDFLSAWSDVKNKRPDLINFS